MTKQKAADQAFLERQRKRLNAMRDELKGAATTLHASTAPEAKELEEEAQDLAQKEIDRTIDAVERQRLHIIERALAKIDEGTYGLSDLSGDPIPKARLEAMPEALFTIQEEESREKQMQR